MFDLKSKVKEGFAGNLGKQNKQNLGFKVLIRTGCWAERGTKKEGNEKQVRNFISSFFIKFAYPKYFYKFIIGYIV